MAWSHGTSPLFPVYKLEQILMRGPSICDTLARCSLQRKCPRSDRIISEQLVDFVPDLLLGEDAPLVGTDPQARAPHVADVLLVQELVGKVWPTQERDAVTHPFHGRVPSTVRDEACHRRVREHALLGSPADDEPRVSDAAPELVQPALVDAVGKVRPDHPQKRASRERQPVGELLEPCGVEDCEAPEGHVDN
uniref:Uncharacterized protein n=1 Tax=Zea mays TaxID=4577 RepID=A0A804M487_MAIZE